MVRDGCIQRCGVNSPMNYRSLVYVLSTVRLVTTKEQLASALVYEKCGQGAIWRSESGVVLRG